LLIGLCDCAQVIVSWSLSLHLQLLMGVFD